jgi:hypothetical protein
LIGVKSQAGRPVDKPSDKFLELIAREDGIKSESTTESDLPRIAIDVSKFGIYGTCDMAYIDVEADDDHFPIPKFWVTWRKCDRDSKQYGDWTLSLREI